MNDASDSTPLRAMDVVLAWWQAVQDQDLDTLADLLDERYISTGGPAGRTVGRRAAVTEAAMFLTSGIVDTWSLGDVLLRDHGDVVVCSYAWEETGRHQDAAFKMSGLATDVVARTPTGWRISAHHTSVTPQAE